VNDAIPFCRKCQLAKSGKAKIYSVEAGNVKLYFDVERALQFTKGRVPYPIPDWLVRRAIQVNDYDEEHLDHVDMSVPLLFGLMPRDTPRECCPIDAHIVDFDDPNSRIFVFLDGSHRAARAIRDRIEVKAFVLDVRETMLCVSGAEVTKGEEIARRKSTA
jgi:hypothetical protein